MGKTIRVECSEFRKLIPLFLDGKLDSLQLDGFTSHVIECSDCETHLLAMPHVTEG